MKPKTTILYFYQQRFKIRVEVVKLEKFLNISNFNQKRFGINPSEMDQGLLM